MVLEVEVGELAAALEGEREQALHLGHGDVGGHARAVVGHEPV